MTINLQGTYNSEFVAKKVHSLFSYFQGPMGSILKQLMNPHARGNSAFSWTRHENNGLNLQFF